MESVRARVLVRGRVQGVFYRQSCAEEARRLGAKGFVKNLPDGRVEAVFEGPSEIVEAMISWCRRGPPHAAVEDLERYDEAPRGDIEGFHVLR